MERYKAQGCCCLVV
ncbi:rCG57557, partial [Rattus norvegicus]